jgi:hypothetical protein
MSRQNLRELAFAKGLMMLIIQSVDRWIGFKCFHLIQLMLVSGCHRAMRDLYPRVSYANTPDNTYKHITIING